MPRPNPVDAAIALLAFAFASLELWSTDHGAALHAQIVAATLPTLPLAWRSVAPARTVLATSGGLCFAVLLGVPSDEPIVPTLAPVIALYSLGALAPWRRLAVTTAASLALYAIGAVSGTAGTDELAITSSALLVAVAVGRAVRIMGFESDRLEEEARTAVVAERARIARELHDVIGHSISVMGVQAGAVRRVLRAEQEDEREMLLAVERTGRDAVAEMSRLLGLLRENGDGAAAAMPTLRRVDDLVADMRRAGLDVELKVEGSLDDVPPGRALAAFRILQEALTNSLKHAPGAHVTATLRRTAADVEIEVVDDGGLGRAPGPGGGHGLVGMRERAAMYGGALEAGPAGRGFRTAARLPLGGA